MLQNVAKWKGIERIINKNFASYQKNVIIQETGRNVVTYKEIERIIKKYFIPSRYSSMVVILIRFSSADGGLGS